MLFCPLSPCPLSYSQCLVQVLWLCEIFEAYIFLSSLVIYILDKFNSALELDQQPGKCHQLSMLTQKKLPGLHLQRLCPAPSKKLKYCSDIHCSHIGASWWAEQAIYHWKPFRAITGAPQGPHDASAITFIQVRWCLSFTTPWAWHRISVLSQLGRYFYYILHDSSLPSMVLHGERFAGRNGPACSWTTMLFMAWLNWAWLLVGLVLVLWVSVQLSSMKSGYLQEMLMLWKSQPTGNA